MCTLSVFLYADACSPDTRFLFTRAQKNNCEHDDGCTLFEFIYVGAKESERQVSTHAAVVSANGIY
jgi:hypothetical protein